jgi:hypothetical protein
MKPCCFHLVDHKIVEIMLLKNEIMLLGSCYWKMKGFFFFFTNILLCFLLSTWTMYRRNLVILKIFFFLGGGNFHNLFSKKSLNLWVKNFKNSTGLREKISHQKILHILDGHLYECLLSHNLQSWAMCIPFRV